MKIKRFNESEELDISKERVGEIIEELKDMLTHLEKKSEFSESLLSEFTKYKNMSKKSNDQIDDSIVALQVVKSDMSSSIDKIDTIINNLMSYNEEGRKFLYTENK
jgi:hypothetical protein